MRDQAFKTALFGINPINGLSAKPDVFLGEEFISAAGLTNFVAIMNAAPNSPGDYVGCTFVDGPDTDSVCIYRSSKLVPIGAPVVVSVGGASPNHPRNIMRYDFKISGYNSSGGMISFYPSHMKAGTATGDEPRRQLEAQQIRADAQALGHAFVLGGDLNVQNSNDLGFSTLVASTTNNAGQFFDPIKTPGTWNNNSGLVYVLTQDPAPGQAGIDDRFDFILFSNDCKDGNGIEYIGNPNVAYSTMTWNDPNHSYRCWGNDGSIFNSSIRISGNAMVGTTIAQAIADTLLNASGSYDSGHLAVLCDVRVPAKIGAPSTLSFGSVRLNRPAVRNLTVSHLGDVSKWTTLGLDNLRFSMVASGAFSVAGGQQTITPGGQLIFPVTMNTSSIGVKFGTLTITSNDPDIPVKVINLDGNVMGQTGIGGVPIP